MININNILDQHKEAGQLYREQQEELMATAVVKVNNIRLFVPRSKKSRLKVDPAANLCSEAKTAERVNL